MMVFPYVLLGYALGCLPMGVMLAGVARVQDPRTLGSQNPGASNMFRSHGSLLGGLTLILDVSKGMLAVWAAEGEGIDVAVAAALAVVVGHVFPLTLGFRGGKGVATSAGALGVLAPHSVLISVALWALVIVLTRISSLASLVAMTSLPLVLYVRGAEVVVLGGSVVIATLVWLAHRQNISRLLSGDELKVR